MTYRTEAPEVQPKPRQWILLVATKFWIGSTPSDCLTHRETGISAEIPRASLCVAMSALNQVRRGVASDKGIPVASVHLYWFDFVLGDEEYAS